MDDDFPFSFGNVSDDDSSDGLFCQPKKASVAASTQSTTVTQVPQKPYYPQVETDGWFHASEKSVQDTMLHEKNGATRIRMRADQFYMLGQYEEAYELADEYCRVIASNGSSHLMDHGNGGMARPEEQGATASSKDVLKVTDPREMEEMMIRCSLKLGRLTDAATLAEDLTDQEPGLALLKAQVWTALGRFNDAAQVLVTLQQARSSSNYAIWRRLGNIVDSSIVHRGLDTNVVLDKDTPLDPLSPAFAVKVNSSAALLALLKARHLMRSSIWPSVDYVQQRYEREMTALEKQIDMLENRWGIVRAALSATDDLTIQSLYQSRIIGPIQEALALLRTGIYTHQLIITPGVLDFIVSAWDEQVLG
ncbi:hypothetical protein BGZ94_001072 [Podila epigama]|nr:hypothetical protein BGZ94_001072 [Podila epigama]